jgi:hypothetical protein
MGRKRKFFWPLSELDKVRISAEEKTLPFPSFRKKGLSWIVNLNPQDSCSPKTMSRILNPRQLVEEMVRKAVEAWGIWDGSDLTGPKVREGKEKVVSNKPKSQTEKEWEKKFEKNASKLTESQKDLVRSWIECGARKAEMNLSDHNEIQSQKNDGICEEELKKREGQFDEEKIYQILSLMEEEVELRWKAVVIAFGQCFVSETGKDGRIGIREGAPFVCDELNRLAGFPQNLLPGAGYASYEEVNGAICQAQDEFKPEIFRKLSGERLAKLVREHSGKNCDRERASKCHKSLLASQRNSIDIRRAPRGASRSVQKQKAKTKK